MKLNDALENYYTLSGKASDISRQLNFVAIALVWLFRVGTNERFAISDDLLLVALLAVAALACDLLQYVTGALVWGAYHRIKEKSVGTDDEFLAPAQLNRPAVTFFWVKLVLTLATYIAIGIALLDRLQ